MRERRRGEEERKGKRVKDEGGRIKRTKEGKKKIKKKFEAEIKTEEEKNERREERERRGGGAGDATYLHRFHSNEDTAQHRW